MTSANTFKPCPLCGGNLALYLVDSTPSMRDNRHPCWEGGATCGQCGGGFDVGSFGGGVRVEYAENYIIKTLNNRVPIQVDE